VNEIGINAVLLNLGATIQELTIHTSTITG